MAEFTRAYSRIQPFSSGQSAILSSLLVVWAVLAGAGCSQPPAAIRLTLVPPTPGAPAFVRLTGLSAEDLASLRQHGLTPDEWQALLRVAVAGAEGPAVAGRYVVTRQAVQFHPRFPFDPGRPYAVRFDPARLPRPRPEPALEAELALPAADVGPAVLVTGISPGGGVWPENLLRFYIHFSAPMSRTSALGFVRLEDDAGREVEDAFLPLDVDLWNAERTRYTVFFDPGRVKRGILPNVELGRALEAGRRYAIVVDAGWRDAHGQPLVSGHRSPFTAAAAVEQAIDVTAWQVQPPPAGGRDPLAIAFPWALDAALLERAIGVSGADGSAIAGTIEVGGGERRWQFVPEEPWRAGPYTLVVLSILEDPAGNRVGRAFEIEMLSTPREAVPEQVAVPFVID